VNQWAREARQFFKWVAASASIVTGTVIVVAYFFENFQSTANASAVTAALEAKNAETNLKIDAVDQARSEDRKFMIEALRRQSDQIKEVATGVNHLRGSMDVLLKGRR
jgi:Zn-dependent oligopeptidase